MSFPISHQNIWPLIYKPLFVPTQTHPALLYSMLSIASVISVPINASTPALPVADHLFQTALHHIHKLTTITPSHAFRLAGGGKRSHIFLCQAYVLMSLRQTRMGDKASAYLYASMASGMCLELGLHRRVGWGPAAGGKKASQVSSFSRRCPGYYPHRPTTFNGRRTKNSGRAYGGVVTSSTRCLRKKQEDQFYSMHEDPRRLCLQLPKRTNSNFGLHHLPRLSCRLGIGRGTMTEVGTTNPLLPQCLSQRKVDC